MPREDANTSFYNRFGLSQAYCSVVLPSSLLPLLKTLTPNSGAWCRRTLAKVSKLHCWYPCLRRPMKAPDTSSAMPLPKLPRLICWEEVSSFGQFFDGLDSLLVGVLVANYACWQRNGHSLWLLCSNAVALLLLSWENLPFASLPLSLTWSRINTMTLSRVSFPPVFQTLKVKMLV